MKWLKSSKRRAAAAAAALLLIGTGVLLTLNRQQVFIGVLKDDSGLAMVREGKTDEIQKEKSRRETLYVAVTDAQGVVNPAYVSGDGDQLISSVIFESLMRRDADGGLTEVLAKGCSFSEDGTECQIQLKPGVKFSDGTELTAQDVAFSLGAMCLTAEDGASSPYLRIQGVGEFRQGITQLPAGIQVTDQHSLKVVFDEPSPDNQNLLLCRIQKQPESLEGGMALVLPQLSMGGTGTGAYVMAQGREGGSIRLEASGNYRHKTGDIKAVEFVIYGSYNVAEAIQKGDVDVACFYGNSGMFDPFYEGKQFHIYEQPLDSVQYLAVNRDSVLFQSASARKAAALAIDRSQITEGPLSRYLMGASALAWETGDYAGDNPVVSDLKKSKELLGQAENETGVTDAKVKLPVLKGSEIQEKLLSEIGKDLEKAGFSVEIDVLGQSEYLQQVYMLEDYDLLLSSSGQWQLPSSYSRLVDDNQGLTVSSLEPEVRDAVNQLETAYTQKELEKAFRHAGTILNQQLPVIPVARQKRFVAVSSDLKHYKMNQYDTFIRNIWEIQVK